MPRPALANVSTASLQAELERRASKLSALLKLRDDVDRQIAELKAIAGKFVKSAPAARKGRKTRKTKAGKKVKAKTGAKRGKRARYEQTADQFVLSLLAGGKVMTSAELGQEWTKAGRKGKVDNALTKLVKAKKLKRRKIRGKKGSKYSLA